ncbi:hypothetical protein L596_025750 [Steinernema carpocapsae]|uniref:Uncharacterized protein n=1 Tax=Steinernema carpocapsae TaxID=34508 RepID=A0A4U5M8X2_STECR|nr:hypothetical protein L596_025750 [Steinernema carpocapsae]
MATSIELFLQHQRVTTGLLSNLLQENDILRNSKKQAEEDLIQARQAYHDLQVKFDQLEAEASKKSSEDSNVTLLKQKILVLENGKKTAEEDRNKALRAYNDFKLKYGQLETSQAKESSSEELEALKKKYEALRSENTTRMYKIRALNDEIRDLKNLENEKLQVENKALTAIKSELEATNRRCTDEIKNLKAKLAFNVKEESELIEGEGLESYQEHELEIAEIAEETEAVYVGNYGSDFVSLLLRSRKTEEMTQNQDKQVCQEAMEEMLKVITDKELANAEYKAQESRKRQNFDPVGDEEPAEKINRLQ